MKKISILLPIAIVLLASCQKSDQYLGEEDPKTNYLKSAHLENKPLAEVNECLIVRISYWLGNESDNLEFIYNSSGDPVSITRTLGAHTGRPDYIFKYDEKNRLTDFVGTYRNTSAEFWHKYFYDSRGNIVLDSGYIFPQIANGFPENGYSRQLTYYTYDNKQRIIRDSTVFSGLYRPVVNIYAYDDNGNRIGNNYDDKININRTNKIWMFLNRDYSVNNPFKAVSYNTNALPASINFSSEGNSLGFLTNSFYKAEIFYQCNSKAK
jgi:hypothetical protein